MNNTLNTWRESLESHNYNLTPTRKKNIARVTVHCSLPPMSYCTLNMNRHEASTINHQSVTLSKVWTNEDVTNWVYEMIFFLSLNHWWGRRRWSLFNLCPNPPNNISLSMKTKLGIKWKYILCSHSKIEFGRGNSY